MSVAFARALAEALTAHGVPVTWEPGAERRGNGQTSRYRGLSLHHTAGQPRNVRDTNLVVGRASPPLGGPLCNSAGLANGGLHIVAAHPANHAGASGGWDTAPLPVTSLFNPLMWGHEIMYLGTVPMSREQWRTAVILGAVVCRLLGHDYDPAWIKTHQSTSVTGKWDMGYAPGVVYPIADYRREVLVVMRGWHAPPPAPTVAPTVPTPLDPQEDSSMIVAMNPGNNAKLPRVYGILDGEGVLTGLDPASSASAANLEAGGKIAVIVLSVNDWQELDRKSRIKLAAAEAAGRPAGG